MVWRAHRIGCRERALCRWHRWYAWYPVRVTKRHWAWLQRVERRGDRQHSWDDSWYVWSYRLLRGA